jgi:hypothetical protein
MDITCFVEKGTTHKIPVLQEKQESGSGLCVIDASRGSMYPPRLVTRENGGVFFTYHGGPLVE